MYLKFENILDKIIEESKIQKHPEKIADFLECVMDELCDLSKEVYEKMTIKFAKMMCEYGFTKELAEYAVAHMKNGDKDHPNGEYWTMREAEDIAKKHNITIVTNGNSNGNGVYLPNFFFTLNMMRSDYFNPELPEDEVCYYVKLAKDWLMDKDVPNIANKSLNYWYHIVKGY